jgi:hypothetical protein
MYDVRGKEGEERERWPDARWNQERYKLRHGDQHGTTLLPPPISCHHSHHSLSQSHFTFSHGTVSVPDLDSSTPIASEHPMVAGKAW